MRRGKVGSARAVDRDCAARECRRSGCDELVALAGGIDVDREGRAGGKGGRSTTFSVENGVPALGASVAPLLTIRSPIVPFPPNVAPASTATDAEGIEASITKAPSSTLTGKTSAFVPTKIQVELSILFKTSKSSYWGPSGYKAEGRALRRQRSLRCCLRTEACCPRP